MIEMELEGLQCTHCAGLIEKTLNQKDYLKEVNLSFATRKLVFQSDLNTPELKERIQKEVDRIEDGITVTFQTDESLQKNEKPSLKMLLKQHGYTLLGSLILAGVLLFPLEGYILLALYLATYVLIGGDILLRALKNLFRGRLFDENFLMSLATIGAFALGEYTEAVAVMLFYKIGEGFQDYAVDRSRKSIKSLMNLKAEWANRLMGNEVERVKPEDLVPGDRIMVRAGEKIPVDSRIIEGNSTLDSSALTGESMPQPAEADQDVYSGSINLDSTLILEVSRLLDDSAVSRILHMVENAAGKKAKTEQFITSFARIYTPIVVLGAALLTVVPVLLGFGSFQEWLSRSLIFLVISCPCALVLSVPLGYFGGLGAAGRKGILIKGGNYLEALNSIDTFLFDKTGTLTKGNFAIEKVEGSKALELGALLEQHSTHPIARAIVETYGKEWDSEAVQNVREYPGKGLSGQYKGYELLVGNQRLMQEFGIEIETTDYAGTLVYVAYDGLPEGILFIRDEIKPGAKELCQELSEHSELIMLTGDQKKIADHAARQLGIKKVFSQLMPQDKLEHLETLINQGKKVLFTGDGINDAPVLARAHIGVAMGGLGSDAAIEAADMVIMDDSPEKILEARKLAKATRRIVMQNIVFALGVKLFFLTLGALGQASMYEAIFADVGVALLAVMNSMRILRK